MLYGYKFIKSFSTMVVAATMAVLVRRRTTHRPVGKTTFTATKSTEYRFLQFDVVYCAVYIFRVTRIRGVCLSRAVLSSCSSSSILACVYCINYYVSVLDRGTGGGGKKEEEKRKKRVTITNLRSDYYRRFRFGIFLDSSTVTGRREEEKKKNEKKNKYEFLRLRMEAVLPGRDRYSSTWYSLDGIILTFTVDRPRFSNCCFPSLNFFLSSLSSPSSSLVTFLLHNQVN